MATYKVSAINVGSFNLGESDKLLTLFSAERGLMKAVAKGARKPGSKMTGRSEILTVNSLLISVGRSLDIITQAETLTTFLPLRSNLERLSYGLFFAELTQILAQEITDEAECQAYFTLLKAALTQLTLPEIEPAWTCLRFALATLEFLGYKPELTYCINCRKVLTEYNLVAFHPDGGGIICTMCRDKSRALMVACDRETSISEDSLVFNNRNSIQITPGVWKHLVLAAKGCELAASESAKPNLKHSLQASNRIMQKYVEHKAGRHIKSLNVIENVGV